jgi:Spy/CpxP family protein refolding chaperone
MIQHRVARLTTLLGLSTSQASQATTIFTNAQTSITPLQTALGGYRTSLQTAIKGNATATIDQLAAEIGTTTGQITDVESKADAAFYAILTADQQSKLDAVGGFGGFGGRGGPGMGPFGRGPRQQ